MAKALSGELDQSQRSTPPWCEQVSDCVGEEVERVGLQRLRYGEVTRHHLADEHDAVDSDDDSQDALGAGVHAIEDGERPLGQQRSSFIGQAAADAIHAGRSGSTKAAGSRQVGVVVQQQSDIG